MILDQNMFDATLRLLGGFAILTGAGWLANARQWSSGGPLGRDLHRWRSARWVRFGMFDLLHDGRGLAVLGLVQMLIGIWLVLLPRQPLIALTALGLIAAAQALRGAGDGADKMAMVVISGCLLQEIGKATGQTALIFAGVLWIGGHLTLAYATAGFSKLRHSVWRDGIAIQGALNSYTNGCGWAARLVDAATSAKLLAWVVMLLEVLFPLALLLPASGLAIVLGFFVLLHLTIAAAMGLHTYPLAFAAAYPSTLLLGQWVRAAVGIA
jgi:hypothetical protein